jgi:hypothetical protein
MIHIRHTLTEGTRLDCIFDGPEGIPPILRRHFVQQNDGTWLLPDSQHMPADRARLYQLKSQLKGHLHPDFWMRIDIEQWVHPEDEAENDDTTSIPPSMAGAYALADLRPLDLVLIQQTWHRVVSCNQRSITVVWDDHPQAIYGTTPGEVREARRPARSRPFALPLAAATVGDLRDLLHGLHGLDTVKILAVLLTNGVRGFYPLTITPRGGFYATSADEQAPCQGHLSQDATAGPAAVALNISGDNASAAVTGKELLTTLHQFDRRRLLLMPQTSDPDSETLTPIAKGIGVTSVNLDRDPAPDSTFPDPEFLVLRPIK